MKIGIISNGDVCTALLYFLKQNRADVHLFLEKSRDKQEGVMHACHAMQIPLTHAADQSLYDWVSTLAPDIIFVVGYGQRIKIAAFPSIPQGVYNVHFGKLPEYRGPSPVFWQMKNGEPTIGVTIHKLVPKLDAGAIVWQKEIQNEPHFTYIYVNAVLSNAFLEGVVYILQNLLTGKTLSETVQDETRAHYDARPALKDIVIDWETMSAMEIRNLIRACNSWNMGAATLYEGMEVKILDADCGSAIHDSAPGTILTLNEQMHVACRNNEILFINILNLDGSIVPAKNAALFGFIKQKQFKGINQLQTT
ncbi:methionyl-tRNA formyltransferase [Taibaiella soli]|uniref:Uncharacterized protein n=1 Tax=Taibaiella soli TaxID=1649169 RepID=A0A2W2AG12_9BACT|nr:formyltransferase family protein [Taibaiella soli]PZF74455.1 hypothetical protein DN068_02420 [Taibaiella soli]